MCRRPRGQLLAASSWPPVLHATSTSRGPQRASKQGTGPKGHDSSCRTRLPGCRGFRYDISRVSMTTQGGCYLQLQCAVLRSHETTQSPNFWSAESGRLRLPGQPRVMTAAATLRASGYSCGAPFVMRDRAWVDAAAPPVPSAAAVGSPWRTGRAWGGRGDSDAPTDGTSEAKAAAAPTLAVQGLHPGELGPARSGISRALTNYTRRARCRTAGATFAASRLIYFPPTLDIEQSCVRKCWHLVCCTLWAFGSLVSGSSCVHVPIASRCLVDMKCLLALVELSSSPACLWGPESTRH